MNVDAARGAVPVNKIKRQIERVKPSVKLNEHEVADYVVKLRKLALDASEKSLEGVDLEKLFTFRVPIMDPDGCSRVDGTLAQDPYDLRKVLFSAEAQSVNGFFKQPQTRQVFVLDALVDRVINDVGVNWLGFYQKRKMRSGDDTLVKLAYRGAESRAEFPLTREFARKSNNSTVGITGTGIIINDIERYLWEEGGPYYQCDSRVHSEACLPVFAASSDEVIGIIDAESHERNKFSEREMTMLFGTCIALEEILAPVS